MSYVRVIPRDLFNEANLLKCYGQIYLNLERLDVSADLSEYGATDDGFRVYQNEDGALTLDNVTLTVRGKACALWRPLNARSPYPLWLAPDGYAGEAEQIAVFNDDGTFTAEMVAFLKGVSE